MVDPSRNLGFRYFLPVDTISRENVPVVVYFHGGGFVLLSASSKPYDDLCRRLAGELAAAVVSVYYRLSPEHKFPCPYEDGVDALKFIDENPPAKADLSRCFVAGDSAGGNIAHRVIARAGENDYLNLKISGSVLIQPFFGGEERTESDLVLSRAPLLSVKGVDWCWKAFLPEGSNRDHPAANVFGPKSVDISELNFPRSMAFIGGFDRLRDWQKRYCEALKRNGKEVKVVDYPNAIHSFYIQKLQDFIYSQ